MKTNRNNAKNAVSKIASHVQMLVPAQNVLILFILMQDHANFVQILLLTVLTVIMDKFVQNVIRAKRGYYHRDIVFVKMDIMMMKEFVLNVKSIIVRNALLQVFAFNVMLPNIG